MHSQLLLGCCERDGQGILAVDGRGRCNRGCGNKSGAQASDLFTLGQRVPGQQPDDSLELGHLLDHLRICHLGPLHHRTFNIADPTDRV